jgi:flagellin-like hook-associated protein FlgL
MKLKIFKRQEVTPEEQGRREALKHAERALKQSEKEHESRVKERQKLLVQAERQHEGAVKDARKEVQGAEKAYDKGVKTAEKRLRDAEQSGGKKLGSYKDVTLYEDRITTAQGTAKLTPDVTASADTAGNLAVTKRITLTRLAAGGIIGGLVFQKKQKHDTRELYLLVETPEFASVTQGGAEDGTKVRDLAAKITTAGRNAAKVARLREHAIESARRELEEARSNRSAIESAVARLRQVEGDVTAVQAAKTALGEIESDTSEIDERRRELGAVQLPDAEEVFPR